MSSPLAPSPESKTARWALASMFAMNGFVMGAWAPQIPLLLERHQISEATLGLLILGLGLGAVSAMAFSGKWIAKHGSIKITVFFAALLVPMLPLIVAAPSVWTTALAMILYGAIAGSMDVAMNANAVEVERKLGRAIMSSSHGFWSFGGFLGGILGSWLIVQTSAQVQSLVIAVIMAAMLVLAASRLRGDAPQPNIAQSGQKSSFLPKDLGIWVLGAMALFSMVPEGAVLDWAAIYMKQEMLASPAMAGLGFAFFSGTMALVRFAGDGLRNRFGAVKTLRASGVIGALGLGVAACAPYPAIAIFGFAVAGLGIANMIPVLFSAAGNYPGQNAGAAIAVVTMIGYAGILVAPASIGFIAEFVGFRATYAVLSLLLLVVVALASRTAAADGAKAH